jgi:hypothetical protein
MARTMGLNTVCAYLFWNQIELRLGAGIGRIKDYRIFVGDELIRR